MKITCTTAEARKAASLALEVVVSDIHDMTRRLVEAKDKKPSAVPAIQGLMKNADETAKALGRMIQALGSCIGSVELSDSETMLLAYSAKKETPNE